MARRGARTWLPRALLAVALVGIAVLLLPGALVDRLTHRELEVVDVGARARAIAARSPDAASLTDWYYRGARASAHLHVIGPGQTVRLHLHERATEAALPVIGAANVTQRAGGASSTSRREEGALVVSPPGCAHEWANASSDASQANLVFSIGEPFAGNVFVAPDDGRIAAAAAPGARGDAVRVVETTGEASLDTAGDTLVYVTSGQGSASREGRTLAIGERSLVVCRARGGRLVLRARPGGPLSVVVVTPPP
jgi:uncharacterized RmlC-like cupin family protein